MNLIRLAGWLLALVGLAALIRAGLHWAGYLSGFYY